MGREETSNSNLVESSVISRGGGLGTPDLPSPSPSTSNPWVSSLHVLNKNSFNDGIVYYYCSTRSIENVNFLKYVLNY